MPLQVATTLAVCYISQRLKDLELEAAFGAAEAYQICLRCIMVRATKMTVQASRGIKHIESTVMLSC